MQHKLLSLLYVKTAQTAAKDRTECNMCSSLVHSFISQIMCFNGVNTFIALSEWNIVGPLKNSAVPEPTLVLVINLTFAASQSSMVSWSD